MTMEDIDDLLKDYKPPVYKLNVYKWKMLSRNFKIVLRHRWDDTAKKKKLDMTFRMWELGFFCRKQKMVGEKDFETPSKWGDNLVSNYIIGFELLIAKIWIEFHKGGKTFEV